jgi:hypothetical protein
MHVMASITTQTTGDGARRRPRRAVKAFFLYREREFVSVS